LVLKIIVVKCEFTQWKERIIQVKEVIHEGTYNVLIGINNLGMKIEGGIQRAFHNQSSIFQLIIDY
jgi:hypothetical protein